MILVLNFGDLKMIHHIIPSPNSDTLIITVSDDSVSAFRELIQRGANLWPAAPPEIKELADLITSGKILQDYRSQSR